MGSAVHEGVQLEFAHRGSTAAATAVGSDSEAADMDGCSGTTGSWRSGLDVLSGGQRTMVSLAFVVAVSRGNGLVGLAGWCALLYRQRRPAGVECQLKLHRRLLKWHALLLAT